MGSRTRGKGRWSVFGFLMPCTLCFTKLETTVYTLLIQNVELNSNNFNLMLTGSFIPHTWIEPLIIVGSMLVLGELRNNLATDHKIIESRGSCHVKEMVTWQQSNVNSLMQGSGGPWENVSPSVGRNYKLRAWWARWGCGNWDKGPGTNVVGRIVESKPGMGNCPNSYRHASLCCTLLYCISQVLLFFSLFFFLTKLKVCVSQPCFQQVFRLHLSNTVCSLHVCVMHW